MMLAEAAGPGWGVVTILCSVIVAFTVPVVISSQANGVCATEPSKDTPHSFTNPRPT